jgi:hypothetical protein
MREALLDNITVNPPRRPAQSIVLAQKTATIQFAAPRRSSDGRLDRTHIERTADSVGRIEYIRQSPTSHGGHGQ